MKLAALIAALLALGLFVGFHLGRTYAPICPEVSIPSLDSAAIASAIYYDSLATVGKARKAIIDSIDSLPAPNERIPDALRFVRAIDLQRQLDSAVTDPS